MADPGIAAMSCFFLLGIDTGITVEKASIKMKRLVSVLRKFRKQWRLLRINTLNHAGMQECSVVSLTAYHQ